MVENPNQTEENDKLLTIKTKEIVIIGHRAQRLELSSFEFRATTKGEIEGDAELITMPSKVVTKFKNRNPHSVKEYPVEEGNGTTHIYASVDSFKSRKETAWTQNTNTHPQRGQG